MKRLEIEVGDFSSLGLKVGFGAPEGFKLVFGQERPEHLALVALPESAGDIVNPAGFTSSLGHSGRGQARPGDEEVPGRRGHAQPQSGPREQDPHQDLPRRRRTPGLRTRQHNIFALSLIPRVRLQDVHE